MAQQPEMPKPGPEHAKLKQLEGTWEATMDFRGQKSSGTMTYKMEMGGFYLVSHFTGEFGGMKFEGRGMDTYDPNKKKYVGVWADNMAPAIMMMEGNFDSSGKKLTMIGEGPSQDGSKQVKYKMVSERKDNDTLVSTMYGPGPDGKEGPMFSITYKRKK
jgi:hypothetical protein